MTDEATYKENIIKYSLKELEDILNHLDKDKYPERYDLIVKEIEERKAYSDKSLAELYEIYSALDKNLQHEQSLEILKEIKRREEESSRAAEPTGRSDRLGAAIVDALILMVPNLIIIFVFYGFDTYLENIRSLNMIQLFSYISIATVIDLLLNGYLLYKYGQTIGKRIMDIKIVDMNNNVPSILRSFVLRKFMFFFLGYIPIIKIGVMLDWVPIFFNDKRCLHDYVAGTKVVNA